MTKPRSKSNHPRQRALLVGINRYPDAPLRGCVNDVLDMGDLLSRSWGFSKESIRLLTDGRATADAILTRLRWLVADAQPGDTLIFHYSGHGTQVPDRNHDGELDGLDEAICPVDFDFDEPQTILKDDEFHTLFQSLPMGVRFLWISDSCHSGDLTSRDVVSPFFKSSYRQSRTFPTPLDHQWRRAGWNEKVTDRPIEKTQKSDLNLAFISGCRSDQTSADACFKGRYNGAFTYFLLKRIRSNRVLSSSLRSLVRVVTQDLHDHGFDQSPCLEGCGADLFNLPVLYEATPPK